MMPVVGGAGFIGSQTVKGLLDRGDDGIMQHYYQSQAQVIV
ncbi:hypothetical protein [Bacillus sp. 165]|nr:hypothetical protein [Bacillus sp. 165]